MSDSPLTRLPQGWHIAKLKYLAGIRFSNVDKRTLDNEETVRLCNYMDVYHNHEITEEMDFMVASASEAEIERFSLKQGDVLITKDSESWDDIAIPSRVATDMPEVLCGYHLAQIRPDPVQLNDRFLNYCLNAPIVQYHFHREATGITRFGLSNGDIGGAPVPVTDVSYQTAIANFLDQETGRIDALIAKEERLLGLLEEKRTALISHAVTQGLDPNAELKDSGIEWLGQIPKGWEVKKLGRACRLQGGYAFKSDLFGEEGIPVVRMNNIKRGRIDLSEIKRVPEAAGKASFALNEGDLVWGMSGSIGETGSLGNFAWVREEDLPLQLNQRVGRFRADHRRLSLRYLGYFLQTSAFYDQILLWVTGTAQFNISSSQVEGVWMAFPSVIEQQALVDLLDAQTARFDALKTKINRAIELLREKRTALISAAVTGKIEMIQGDKP